MKKRKGGKRPHELRQEAQQQLQNRSVGLEGEKESSRRGEKRAAASRRQEGQSGEPRG